MIKEEAIVGRDTTGPNAIFTQTVQRDRCDWCCQI